uniref:Uncharacterized protein n=1 Tax=Arundo donax TaxID=35708 RepID=A0A0A9GTV1_ARUDO
MKDVVALLTEIRRPAAAAGDDAKPMPASAAAAAAAPVSPPVRSGHSSSCSFGVSDYST